MVKSFVIESIPREMYIKEAILDYGKGIGGLDRGNGIIVSYTHLRQPMEGYEKKIFCSRTGICR